MKLHNIFYVGPLYYFDRSIVLILFDLPDIFCMILHTFGIKHKLVNLLDFASHVLFFFISLHKFQMDNLRL